MKRNAKRILTLLIAATALLAIPFTFVACNKNKSLLDPKKPTTLTMWHVYGEQANSPMNDFVEKFNATVGKEKGIVIDVTLMSNAAQIGKKLKDAQAGKAGSKDMPPVLLSLGRRAKSWGGQPSELERLFHAVRTGRLRPRFSERRHAGRPPFGFPRFQIDLYAVHRGRSF